MLEILPSLNINSIMYGLVRVYCANASSKISSLIDKITRLIA